MVQSDVSSCKGGTVYNQRFGGCVAKGNCYVDVYCRAVGDDPTWEESDGYTPGTNQCPDEYPDLYPVTRDVRKKLCNLSTTMNKGVGRRCEWLDDSIGLPGKYSCWNYFDMSFLP